MTNQIRLYLAAITAGLGACAGALLAGNVSQSLAFWAVAQNGPSFLREPINAVMALLILLAWQKWRPIANFSPPKWGHLAIGLGLGLCVGIALPGLALAAMTWLQLTSIKPPSLAPVLLGVPFIALIIHGVAEEALIRGIAQREGHTHFGPWGGILVAAISFAILQALQGYSGVMLICNSLLFGAVLGFLALGPGGIWSAIGAHAGWSWLETAVLGERGQIVKTGSFWAGSGPDSYASPLFTVVLVCVLGVQIVLQQQAQKRMSM